MLDLIVIALVIGVPLWLLLDPPALFWGALDWLEAIVTYAVWEIRQWLRGDG